MKILFPPLAQRPGRALRRQPDCLPLVDVFLPRSVHRREISGSGRT